MQEFVDFLHLHIKSPCSSGRYVRADVSMTKTQLAITTDLYSHVMPTALRAAADAMDRVLVQPN